MACWWSHPSHLHFFYLRFFFRYVLGTQYRLIYWNFAKTTEASRPDESIGFQGEDPATLAIDSAPFSRFILKPNSQIKGWKFTKKNYWDDTDILFKINSLGYREKEFTVEKEPGVFRIFAIGGSTTFGYKRNEQGWPAQLEALIQQNLPPGINRVEVLNTGVFWYSSYDSLTDMLFNITRFSPDGIIIFHGVNDRSDM